MNGKYTIEPRLIALLNDAPHYLFASSPSLELPPLHDPNILKASGRPLLLEPDASSKQNGKPASKSRLEINHNTILPPLDDEKNAYKEHGRKRKAGHSSQDRALGLTSPQSLRKILDNDTGATSTVTSQRRQINEPNKEQRQLPQPPKKQKIAKQVVPPMIIGLFEPPPQAALFPPIASSSFHDSHGRNTLNTIPIKANTARELPKSNPPSSSEKPSPPSKPTPKRNATKTRKKWSEEETNNLLLGVHKYGIGCWVDILADQVFNFDGRSAVDLKDRFRTVGPTELRKKTRLEGFSKNAKPAKSKSSLMSENILIHDDGLENLLGNNPVLAGQSRSRAHRKKMEDLAQLGIEGPIQKSKRRERRAFTEEEDRALLEGYNTYGPSWSKIHKDPQLGLHSRQPTDLRDRFRNKCPEKFRDDKPAKSLMPKKVPEKGKSDLQPSEAFLKEPATGQPTHRTSREALSIKDITTDFSSIIENPSVDSTDNLPFSQSFDWNQRTTAPFSNGIGEMDISRLLLFEPWDMPSSNGKEKDSNTSNPETMHNLPSFMNMLNDPIDDINDASFG